MDKLKDFIAGLISRVYIAWALLPAKAQSIIRHAVAAAVVAVALFDYNQFATLDVDGFKVAAAAFAGATLGAVWRIVVLELFPYVIDALLKFANRLYPES